MSRDAMILRDETGAVDGNAVSARLCFDESEAQAMQAQFDARIYKTTKHQRTLRAGGVWLNVWVLVIRDKRAAEQLTLEATP